jgi:ornithine cyclodeaminase
MTHRTLVRVVDGPTVRSLLTHEACIDVVRDAMVKVSRGQALLPLRRGMALPTGAGALGQMPGYLGDPECFGIKLVSLFPGNRARGLPTHLGAYLLYEALTGEPRALLNANELTAIRTAAATAVATLALMRADSKALAILGTGEQAREHIVALTRAHPFERILLWGRSGQKAHALAAQFPSQPIEIVATTEDAVQDADVICTVTASKTPVLAGRALRDGQHLNLVGASFPDAREIDDHAVERGRYFVDYRASALDQAGELLHAIQAGCVTAHHVVAEVGEVLDGLTPGRSSDREITIYKSLGIAAQDLAAATYVLRAAEQANVGTVVSL